MNNNRAIQPQLRTFEIAFNDPKRNHVFLYGANMGVILHELTTHYGSSILDVNWIEEVKIPYDPKTRKGDLLK